MSVLNAAYAQATYNGYPGHTARNHENWCTDIEWETGGGEHGFAEPLINFTWNASSDVRMFNVFWQKPYQAIRDANAVLDNLKKVKNISDSQKQEIKAEARFVRVICYYYMYMWFGPVPLRTSNNQKLELSRPSDDKMKSFIESELLAVIPQLPAPGQEAAYGRANSGAALGFLCKFYLNTKQWKKAAKTAKKIMDIGYYRLYPNYADMFKVQNEDKARRSYLWVDQALPKQGLGTQYINGAAPPGIKKWPKTGLIYQSSWQNWGAQYRLYDAFYHSFNSNDERRYPIMTKYVNKKESTIDLLKSGLSARSFKYWPTVKVANNDHGDDKPVIRYADILLSRAEALNNMNDPNQESINLINKVRERAGLNDLTLSQFSTKESLNNYLLKARGWEFYTEGDIRREDLIRIGKFVSSARARGHANAMPYMVRFPIPQKAIDANPKLEQNPDYN
jgi:hypothetical protein